VVNGDQGIKYTYKELPLKA